MSMAIIAFILIIEKFAARERKNLPREHHRNY